MDFSKALTYPFEDQDWLKKLGIAALVQFIPILNAIALQGWGFETARSVKAGAATPLASWDNFGDTIMKGLTLFLANLLYSLPGLLFVCLGYASTFAFAAAAGSSDSDSAGALASVGGIAVICCYCLAFLVFVGAYIVFAGGYIRYMDRPEFGTFMQFGENFSLVQNNIGDFLMAALFIAGAGLIASFVGSITVIGSLLIYPFLTYFSSHIIGQLAAKLGGAAKPAM